MNDFTCFYCQKRPQTHRSSVARELATVLDTSLLQALILTRQSSVATDLLKGLSYCDLKICEEFLKERSDYMVLLELYRSNDMHREALQLLNRLVEESKSEMANIDFSKRFNPQMIIEYLRVLFFLLYYSVLSYNRYCSSHFHVYILKTIKTNQLLICCWLNGVLFV